MAEIGRRFKLHPLVQEDILNTQQRPGRQRHRRLFAKATRVEQRRQHDHLADEARHGRQAGDGQRADDEGQAQKRHGRRDGAAEQGYFVVVQVDVAHRHQIDRVGKAVVRLDFADVDRVFLDLARAVDEFGAAAAAVGVDGVLVVDYPPAESHEFARAMRANSLDPIFLLAPTSTPERIGEVAALASGYVYYVSLKGVTGSAQLDVAAVAERIPQIQAQTGVPVGVGFGIRDAQSAGAVARVADAVVVGSRIIEEIERSTADNVVDRVGALVAELRRGIDDAVAAH